MDPQLSDRSQRSEQETKDQSEKEKTPVELLKHVYLDFSEISEDMFKQIKNKFFSIPQKKLIGIIRKFFKGDENMIKQSLASAHIFIPRLIKLDLPHSLLNGYLILLERHRKLAAQFVNKEELQKIQDIIPLKFIPYYHDLFKIPVKEEKVQKIIENLLDKKFFKHCCKMIKIAGKNLQYVDMLVKAASQKNDQKIADYIKQLGYGAEQYPEIQEDLLFDSMMYFLRKKGWEFAEQIYFFQPKLLSKLVGKMLAEKKLAKEAISMCKRNPRIINLLRHSELMRKQIRQTKYFSKNFLQTDQFAPSDKNKYFSFEDFGIKDKDVLFVDPQYPRIEDFLQQILSSDKIGIDTQSIVARTKLNSDYSLLALIQISTSKKVYLFDGLKEQNPLVYKYFEKIFDDPQTTIIGHTINDDFNLTLKKFKYSKRPKCQILDVKDVFQKCFPEQKKISLTFISQKVLGKPICKEFTLTNWERRPLHLNQVHYAAMDAFIVLKIEEKLREIKNETNKE